MSNPCLVHDVRSVILSEYRDHGVREGLIHPTRDFWIDHLLRGIRHFINLRQEIRNELGVPFEMNPRPWRSASDGRFQLFLHWRISE